MKLVKHDSLEHIQFDLTELIRINRLVRDRVDLEGFRHWYGDLDLKEKIVLLLHLHLFAQQAGYDDQLIQSAAVNASLPADNLLVTQALSFRGGYCSTFGDEESWLAELSAGERSEVLTFFVHLFALASNAALVRCTKESCNHWWHRDLLDEAVVRAVLADPDYAQTSMRDDA